MRALVRSVLRRKRQRQIKLLTPNSPANSDVYVVEFPKSGITWMCTLIANFCLLERGMHHQRATHFNLETFIGDVHQSAVLRAHPVFSGLRVIKSHAAYHPQYRHVIYLIRNPLSVMTSYFHFATGRGDFTGSFREFIEHPKYGIGAWVEHVTSWIDPERQLKLHLVRYEDLRRDTPATLASVLLNLGYHPTADRLAEAVDLSSFEAMQRDNDHYRSHCPFRRYDFVREGKVTPEMSADDKRLILRRAGALVDRFFGELAL
jgi:hypothetical protein